MSYAGALGVKKFYNSTMQHFMMLQHQIKTHEKWQWVSGESTLKGVLTAHQAVEAQTAAFAVDFFIMDTAGKGTNLGAELHV